MLRISLGNLDDLISIDFLCISSSLAESYHVVEVCCMHVFFLTIVKSYGIKKMKVFVHFGSNTDVMFKWKRECVDKNRLDGMNYAANSSRGELVS